MIRKGSTRAYVLRDSKEVAIRAAKEVVARGYVFVFGTSGRVEARLLVGITEEEDRQKLMKKVFKS